MLARTSENPEGPWSAPTMLLNTRQTDGEIYAPYIHPVTSGNELYFTASRWSDCNVLLLKTDLDTLAK
nr:DUF4185 domain-containing protein [Rhodococcus rhodochrous]